jgi:putative DNA primase/helicase
MSELGDRCRNRWPEILRAIDPSLSDDLLIRHRNVPCPACHGRDRFQFTDKGWGRWHCRGINKGGDGVALVMHLLGCDFREAAKRIEIALGIRPRGQDMPPIIIPRETISPRVEMVGDTDKPWHEALPSIRSTAAERYFVNRRRLTLTDIEATALRFAPRLKHWPSGTYWPAVVALVATCDGIPLSAHMTFLARDGLAKAPVEKPKLFPNGAHPVGGGVWFGRAAPGRELIVAEGIETTLSAMRLCGAVSGCAALSAVGISKLILPSEAKRVRVYADNDAAGQGVRAACEARQRWQAEGRTVAIIHACEVGIDANDIWQRRACR